jgi:hypothetical protein
LTTKNFLEEPCHGLLLLRLRIIGNSHVMMMDKNNLLIAGVIHSWLKGKGLVKKR